MSQFSWNPTSEAVKQQLSLELSLHCNSSWKLGTRSSRWPGEGFTAMLDRQAGKVSPPWNPECREDTVHKYVTGKLFCAHAQKLQLMSLLHYSFPTKIPAHVHRRHRPLERRDIYLLTPPRPSKARRFNPQAAPRPSPRRYWVTTTG